MSNNLREELQKEAYSGMTPDEKLIAVNTPNIDTGARQLVPLWQIKKLCIETGVWIALKTASMQTESLPLAYVAQTVIEYINDLRFENLDMDLQSTKTLIGTLVQAGIMTQVQADQIDEMANVKISIAEQIIGRNVSITEVLEAI